MKTKILILWIFASFAVEADTLDPVVLGIVELAQQDLSEVAATISALNLQMVHEEAIEKRIQALLMTSVLEAKIGNAEQSISLLKQAKVIFRQPNFQRQFQTPAELRDRQRIEDSIALIEYDLRQILEREEL